MAGERDGEIDGEIDSEIDSEIDNEQDVEILSEYGGEIAAARDYAIGRCSDPDRDPPS